MVNLPCLWDIHIKIKFASSTQRSGLEMLIGEVSRIWLKLPPPGTGRKKWTRTKPWEIPNLTTWTEEKPVKKNKNKR